MYAIAGVSGNTGSVVADTLLAQGKKVRVIVRDPKKGDAWKAKGADVAVAELGDQAALERALTGVEGAYLLVPPKLDSATPLEYGIGLAKTYAAALKAAKVPHVVLLSSIGAQHATGTGPIRYLHVAEKELAAVTALTSIRAAYFQENWKNSLGALAQNILPTFTPTDVRFPQVATSDIGRTAAAALVEGPHGTQIIELTGPRDYSAADAAAALSKLTNKTITATQFPLDGVVPTLTGFGISAPVAELFREMYEGIAAGRVAPEGGRARNIAGTVELSTTLAALVG